MSRREEQRENGRGGEVTVEDMHHGRSAAGTKAAIEMESHLYQTSEPVPAVLPCHSEPCQTLRP